MKYWVLVVIIEASKFGSTGPDINQPRYFEWDERDMFHEMWRQQNQHDYTSCHVNWYPDPAIINWIAKHIQCITHSAGHRNRKVIRMV